LIIRTWGCQNSACLLQFDSGERNPACPHCGCVRVGWVPGKLNIHSGATKQADTTLRDLCAAYGLTDINSPSPSRQPQAKILAKPGAGVAGTMNFQGFAASIDPQGAVSQNNQSGAECLPTANRFDVKVRSAAEQKLAGQMRFKSISENTEVVARHRGDA